MKTWSHAKLQGQLCAPVGGDSQLYMYLLQFARYKKSVQEDIEATDHSSCSLFLVL